jgi:hypothetical protein
MLSSSLEYSPIPSDGIGKDASLAYGKTKRLFAIYILARPDRGERYWHVPVIGRSHNDGVDIGACSQISKVAVAPTAPESTVSPLTGVVLFNGTTGRFAPQVFAFIAVAVGVWTVLGPT